ncbi:MAG TPA: YqaA family protein [Candidatus Omnitrophota bacterium]|nr:YqaA family protein [Candidatus Omnitrophota bacterium]
MAQALINIVMAPVRWMRKLYNWTLHWSKTRQAPYALFGIAFAESSFFPIPPDVLLIPTVIADKKGWIRKAAVCTAGSVCGAFLGYFIGWCFFETVGKIIVETYHLEAAVKLVGQKYAENAFLTVFTAAFTPIPYKVITIAGGLFRIPLSVLFVASVLGRGARFFIVAGALRIFGERIEKTIEKYFDVFSIVFIVLLIGGFIVLKHAAK